MTDVQTPIDGFRKLLEPLSRETLLGIMTDYAAAMVGGRVEVGNGVVITPVVGPVGMTVALPPAPTEPGLKPRTTRRPRAAATDPDARENGPGSKGGRAPSAEHVEARAHVLRLLARSEVSMVYPEIKAKLAAQKTPVEKALLLRVLQGLHTKGYVKRIAGAFALTDAGRDAAREAGKA